MLWHKRLNEVIAKDTHFAGKKSIERYNCAQVFFGVTSKMLYVTGMKTETELPDVYLDFISQHVKKSELWWDNVKSEMSQRVRQIHKYKVIADK
jgi:hypothetical protein